MVHPRHVLRVAVSGDGRGGVAGVGIVAHEKIKRGRSGAVVEEVSLRVEAGARSLLDEALVAALRLARERGWTRVDLVATEKAMRALQRDHEAGGRGRRVLAATEGLSVRFRWGSRGATSRARALARRASGVEARRREARDERDGSLALWELGVLLEMERLASCGVDEPDDWLPFAMDAERPAWDDVHDDVAERWRGVLHDGAPFPTDADRPPWDDNSDDLPQRWRGVLHDGAAFPTDADRPPWDDDSDDLPQRWRGVLHDGAAFPTDADRPPWDDVSDDLPQRWHGALHDAAPFPTDADRPAWDERDDEALWVDDAG